MLCARLHRAHRANVKLGGSIEVSKRPRERMERIFCGARGAGLPGMILPVTTILPRL